MKRDATQTIWRTVVFAGAMLGAPACHKNKPAPTTPTNTTQTPTPGHDAPQPPDTANKAPDPTPTADPCAGQDRPRGADDDGGGGVGRGFVLS